MSQNLKIFGIFIAIFTMWLFTPIVIGMFDFDIAHQGQFGDLFGSVNALFSGLAFAGLTITICLQRKELSLQRRELQLQRREMRESRKELANQAKAQRLLCLATSGQIRVAAIQNFIESKKLGAVNNPIQRRQLHQLINASADVIAQIAEKIEKESESG
jgi:hypothetical protein